LHHVLRGGEISGVNKQLQAQAMERGGVKVREIHVGDSRPEVDSWADHCNGRRCRSADPRERGDKSPWSYGEANVSHAVSLANTKLANTKLANTNLANTKLANTKLAGSAGR
jgi:hypothetical protein